MYPGPHRAQAARHSAGQPPSITGPTALAKPPLSSVPTSVPSQVAPPGFEPLSFTAVGVDRFWVLGAEPCGSGRCASILATDDGGRTFTHLPAPDLDVAGQAAPLSSGLAVPTLRFADPLDGYAFITDARGAPIFSTHDAGHTWTPLSLPFRDSGTEVLAFAIGGGDAYLITARCGSPGCGSYQLLVSPVGRDTWNPDPLPFAVFSPQIDMETAGDNLWIMGSASVTTDDLAVSSNDGQSFVTYPGPCVTSLGGYLDPVSSTEVWALCPTGLRAELRRSLNGGQSFETASSPELQNSAEFAAASDQTAVLATGVPPIQLLRTTDGASAGTPSRLRRAPTTGTGSASLTRASERPWWS